MIEMLHPDLDLAVRTLRSNSSSIVFAKNGRILYECMGKGVSCYLGAIESQDGSLRNAALADTVTGRAVALLSAYAGIKIAYAEIISQGAIEVFTSYGIPFIYGRKVPIILNSNKTEQCPFERLVSDIRDPEKAFLKLTQAPRFQKNQDAAGTNR